MLYSVCYGFWIARRPESYVNLFDDPVFARAIANTVVFLIVGINLKMAAALFLSNFFVETRRWIRWVDPVYLALGTALDPNHFVDPLSCSTLNGGS